MCGIYFYIDYYITNKTVPRLDKINAIKHRGPDELQVRHFNSSLTKVSITTAFHRLAIMDTSHSAMQPFEFYGFFCLVNGEIWNSDEIKKLLMEETDWEPHSNSDCEVLIPLFLMYDKDPVKLCQKLDGHYSFIIYDSNEDMLYMGTDELSIRPLFYSMTEEGFGIASEMKALIENNKEKEDTENENNKENEKKQIIKRVGASSCTSINILDLKKEKMNYDMKWETYFDWDIPVREDMEYSEAMMTLRDLLSHSVRKELRTDRDYGFFLSGGLDSSLVDAISTMILRSELEDPTIRIKTFTVGIVGDPLMVGAGREELPEDIKNARLVAEQLNSNHHEYLFTMEEALGVIPEVIRICETWDQTTIRASVPMYLGMRMLKTMYPNIAVIYSGEVADELLAGYLYNHMAPSSEDIRKDAIRLLKEIHCFDGKRLDRMVAAFGCEARPPFADKNLIKHVLSCPPQFFDPNKTRGIEKFILRDGWKKLDTMTKHGILPDAILWRTKEALSDASSHKSSWKKFIKSQIPKEFMDNDTGKGEDLNKSEDAWYKSIFDSYYKGFDSIIPHKWMPPKEWCPEAASLGDSSATALSIHDERLEKGEKDIERIIRMKNTKNQVNNPEYFIK